MLVPDQVRVDQIEGLAKEVMQVSRDTLAVKLRFLNPALSRLELLPSTWPLATDGVRLLYDPVYVLHAYAKERNMPVRSYLHVVLHCVFQHFYVDLRVDQTIWNLACDMAVEAMITEMGLDCAQVAREQRQQEALAPIRKAVGQLTAEKLYHYLLRHRPDVDSLVHLSRLFWADEHEAWYIASVTDEWNEQGERASKEAGDSDKEGYVGANHQLSEDAGRMAQAKRRLREQWEAVSQRLQVDLETFSKQTGDRALGLMQNLAAVNRETYDYAGFLKKFAALGEVMQVDDDEFDYIFYTYGLQLYQNIPLIEPLEYKEVKRIKEFVIAIDTSGSVSGELVQTFVQKTYNILMQQENFFTKINLHIIQCDAVVQEDVKITNQEEFARYLANMQLKGAGGTDFRPVFRHVDQMLRHHELTNLKGLLYFTDGQGIFPEQQPPYRAAFVFIQEDYREPEVPPWAIKLVLQRYELEADGVNGNESGRSTR